MPRLNKDDVLDPVDVPSILESTLAIFALIFAQRLARLEQDLKLARRQLDRLECEVMEREMEHG